MVVVVGSRDHRLNPSPSTWTGLDWTWTRAWQLWGPEWSWSALLRLYIFSHESNSTIANIFLSVHLSVCLSVRLKSKPLCLSELPIDHQAYQPSSLTTIQPINHWAYRPSSLLTIKPIDHQVYRPSSPLTIKPIELWSSFATFKPFGLLLIQK